MKTCTLLSYLTSGTMAGYMLHDLIHAPEIAHLTGQPEGYRERGKIGRLYYRLLWEAKLRLLPWKAPRNSWVLIPNETMLCLKASVLQYLQRQGLRLAALLIDPVDASYPTAKCAKQLLAQVNFDLVLTFDPRDAEQYGWKYVNTLYSQFPVENSAEASDLFYIGAVKDRLPACLTLLKQAQQQGADFCLKLLGTSPQQQEQLPSDAILTKPLPYPQTLSWLLGTNCILDMTQPGQSGITLRYYEAVVYQKKLLTNNPNIVDLPGYDPETMRIYEDITQLDWDWIRQKVTHRHPYDGQFSPLHLLSLLKE